MLNVALIVGDDVLYFSTQSVKCFEHHGEKGMSIGITLKGRDGMYEREIDGVTAVYLIAAKGVWQKMPFTAADVEALLSNQDKQQGHS